MSRAGSGAAGRRLNRDIRPLPVIACHVVAWVLAAVAAALVLSDGRPTIEPIVVFGMFGAMVGFLTGLLHVGVRVVRG